MPEQDTIMTRSGDAGKTSLVGGRRVPKSSLRVNAYGTVDELNSVFGMVRCEELPDGLDEKVLQLQNELLDLGSELASPLSDVSAENRLHVSQQQVDRLESWLQEVNCQLEPANNFILPGGSRAAAVFHLARTVTRRCERQVVALLESGEDVNPHCLKFLNRLSDLCFVWARFCNNYGKNDIRWQPGQLR